MLVAIVICSIGSFFPGLMMCLFTKSIHKIRHCTIVAFKPQISTQSRPMSNDFMFFSFIFILFSFKYRYRYKCLYFIYAHSLWLNNIIKETLRQIHPMYAIGFVKKKLSQILIFECNQINGQVYTINCFLVPNWNGFGSLENFFFCFSIHFGNAESVSHESFILHVIFFCCTSDFLFVFIDSARWITSSLKVFPILDFIWNMT